MIRRMLTQYECEVCGKRSFNRNEIQACEIKHYNTTIDTLDSWEARRARYIMAESTYYFDHSEHNKTVLEESEKSLKKFEERNNLRQITIHCKFLDEENGVIEYIAKAGNDVICRCEIHKKDNSSNTWVIPAWFTEDGYKNRGIGTAVLASALRDMRTAFGIPDHIEYIWNGQNQYVYDWLIKNFDAVCKCPIAVQKTQPGDDWDSHIYELDCNKVLRFAGAL